MLSSDAIVIRDGKESKIPAEDLVPGDVVKLGLGDRIPAGSFSQSFYYF